MFKSSKIPENCATTWLKWCGVVAMPPPPFPFFTYWTACDAAFVLWTLLSSQLRVEVGPLLPTSRTFAFIRRWGTILCPSWCGLFCCLACSSSPLPRCGRHGSWLYDRRRCRDLGTSAASAAPRRRRTTCFILLCNKGKGKKKVAQNLLLLSMAKQKTWRDIVVNKRQKLLFVS